MGQCCSTGNSKNLDEIHLINQNDDEEITESSQKKKKSLRETLELLDPGVKYDIEFDTVSFWGRFSSKENGVNFFNFSLKIYSRKSSN